MVIIFRYLCFYDSKPVKVDLPYDFSLLQEAKYHGYFLLDIRGPSVPSSGYFSFLYHSLDEIFRTEFLIPTSISQYMPYWFRIECPTVIKALFCLCGCQSMITCAVKGIPDSLTKLSATCLHMFRDFANISYRLCIRYLSIKSFVTFNLLNINNMHNFLHINLL